MGLKVRLPHPCDNQVGDPWAGLDGATDGQEGRGFGDYGIAAENIFPDHQVDKAGFVFQRHKGDTGSGAWALAADDYAPFDFK